MIIDIKPFLEKKEKIERCKDLIERMVAMPDYCYPSSVLNPDDIRNTMVESMDEINFSNADEWLREIEIIYREKLAILKYFS
ncbi:MAG TPA: hypothetical protein V6C58_23640 [Allocoleopsis sp.]